VRVAGAAQPLDVEDVPGQFIQGPFTEVDPLGRHRSVDQLQQMVGEMGVAAMGNHLAQLRVEMRALGFVWLGIHGPLSVKVEHC
jgi:hypothetical protein